MTTPDKEAPDAAEAPYEHHRFEASQGQKPLRVDKFLVNFIEHASRNKIQQAAQAGHILVNDQAVKANHKVKAGDIVRVILSHPPHQGPISAEDIPLDIIYEDEQLLVVNKEANSVVHPGHGNWSGTLVNGLVYHFDKLPVSPHTLVRPGLVHRIDKGTSGLLVVAKTAHALNKLARQFFDKTTEREYLALVWGDLPQAQGTLRGRIGRNPKNRMQMAVLEDPEAGKAAVTHYRVVERFDYVTLISCRLETGRTHQIRAHLTHLGHPLFNDTRYGGDKILRGTRFSKYRQFVENNFKIMPRQALHAKTLGFIHPVTGQKMRFDSELPADFSTVIARWKNYTKNRLDA